MFTCFLVLVVPPTWLREPTAFALSGSLVSYLCLVLVCFADLICPNCLHIIGTLNFSTFSALQHLSTSFIINTHVWSQDLAHTSLIFKFWMGICAFPLLFFCFSVATASYPEAISGAESFCWSGLQPIILQSGAPSEFWCKEASYLTIWLWKHCGNTTRQFAALECGPPDLLSSALARRLQIPGGTSFDNTST